MPQGRPSWWPYSIWRATAARAVWSAPSPEARAWLATELAELREGFEPRAVLIVATGPSAGLFAELPGIAPESLGDAAHAALPLAARLLAMAEEGFELGDILTAIDRAWREDRSKLVDDLAFANLNKAFAGQETKTGSITQIQGLFDDRQPGFYLVNLLFQV